MQGSHIITCCPQCTTQFRVTPGQLKIAAGQVRCGHCLAVFSAIEHALTESAAPEKIQQRKAAPKPASAPQKKIRQQKQQQPSPAETKPITRSPGPAREKPATETLFKTVKPTKEAVPTLTIQSEPVVLNKPEKASTATSAGWFFACLLAVSGLLLQHLWFNRGELYSAPAYKPLYDFACQQIDCRLPLRSDLSKISSRAFHVRPHNNIENAITIDLILLNEADFSQPFPALGISFTDLKNRPVAARLLQPESYLDPTVVDPLSMPPQQPVQISLDLMSPGTRGVSYELELLAPTL